MNKIFIAFFVLGSLFISCNLNKTNKNAPLSYSTKDCEQTSITIDISELINNKTKYDNKLIEVTGYYFGGLEESVFCQYPAGTRNNFDNSAFVKFKPELCKVSPDRNTMSIDDIGNVKNVSGNKLKIRDIVEARQFKLHPVLIRDICYSEIIKN